MTLWMTSLCDCILKKQDKVELKQADVRYKGGAFSTFKIGITLALFKDFEKMPCLREMLNMKRRGFLIMPKTDLILC